MNERSAGERLRDLFLAGRLYAVHGGRRPYADIVRVDDLPLRVWADRRFASREGRNVSLLRAVEAALKKLEEPED